MRNPVLMLLPVLLLALVASASGCSGEGASTPTPTPTPTSVPTVTPTVGPTQTPVPTPTGVAENFRLLISDDANAIEDFEYLYVSISAIGIHRTGGSGNESAGWLEFPSQVKEVDLRLLVGEKAQVIWGGNITPGEYNKVFIYVSDAQGNLTAANGNETVDVKLPSNKLQISKRFVVTDDSVTSFVYDVAVVAAGNEQSGVKYILRPQLAYSGADQKFEDVPPEV